MALASVSSQNRENQPKKNSVLLFIHTLILISTQVVSSKNTPIFACDIVKNHSLANFKFCDSSAGLAERVKDLVGRLSLEEKIGFLVNTGGSVDRLGIPSYEWWNEGIHGVGGNGSWGTKFSDLVPAATYYPQVILTAASCNTSLFEAIGKAISTEARAMHNVGLAGLTLFAPNINILRDPRWGRGQETPGEDPVLTSSYASAFVRGLQQIRDDDDMGRLKVAACCKHYVAYDLDNWKGIQREHFNAVVTKQDLEDTFRPPFKSCVTEGNAAGLMCSYNEINGKPSCDDPELASVVRGEWNLNGYIISDYDAVEFSFTRQNYTKTPEENAALALLAGVDVNVGSFLKNYTGAAVKAGLVNESVVDRAISYNFATLMRLGFFNGDPRAQLYGELGPKDVCSEEHQKLALEAARQGIVLLKNSQGSLPLSKDIKYLAVIGPNADAKSTMLGNYAGNACNYISPLDGIKEIAPVMYYDGCSESCDTRQIDEAKQLAASSEATILIMGDNLFFEQEYTDRIDLTLPGQQQLLITEVASAVKGPLILVIMSGGGMDVQFAKDNANITSILWVGYPGEAGGAAIADVIFGLHNPGGKLPMSWYPQSYTKIPMTNMNMRPDPSSGYPGRTYRFYTGPMVYNFGDGLSYTIFTQQLVQAPEFVSIPLEENHFCRLTECKSIHVSENYCQNVAFEVRVRLKNEGKMRGSETVLLFSSPPLVHNAPKKQLLAFEKVFLEAETEGMVKFKVDVCKDLSVVDEVGSRKIAFGLHLLHVGSLEHNLNVGI